MKELKVGIVGCGLISKKRHIPGFLKNKNVKSISVCDLNIDLAKQTASDFHLSSAYATLTEMLERQKLDIVDICTPPQVHAPVALQAIEAGCNVLMEKPMALTVSDCDKMISAAKKNNVKLCTVHNNLYHQPFIRAKKLVDSGEIGDFINMRIFLSTPKNDLISMKNHWVHKLPGGIIGETGPHIAYMSKAFLHDIIRVDVKAKQYNQYEWAPYDQFTIEIEADNGISSSISTYTNDYWAADVDIFCTKEALHLDLQSFTLTRFKRNDLKNTTLARSSLGISYNVFSNVLSNGVSAVMGNVKVGHDIVIEKFVESIINNIELPVTEQQGRDAVEIMEFVVNSLNQRRDLN